MLARTTERRHFFITSSHAKPRPNGCRLVVGRKTNRRRGLSVDLAETPKGAPSAKRRIADGLFYSFPKTSPQCLHELPNVGISQLPLPHTKGDARWVSPFAWWEEVDSNYRSRRRQIYSLIHLAALESSRVLLNWRRLRVGSGAGDWNRTHNLLITNQLLCQLSYTSMGWCLGAESNHRHRDFQSLALPTELPRHLKACLAAHICYQTGFL